MLQSYEDGLIRTATFSEDRKRRFDLVRDWRDEIGAPDRTALFAMLNPSKAGEKDDDPTVRKTVGFGRRWGFGRVVLVNVNPIVSTDPWALPPWSGIDAENRSIIERWMRRVDLVAVAWGSPPRALCRTISFAELVYSFRQSCPLALHCIGTTKDGEPLHPSRAPYTASPELWREADPSE
jgi:hypothetical protein